MPSGLIVGQTPGNWPGISLLAFVFGYSANSFIALLEWANRKVLMSARGEGDDKGKAA